MVDMTEPIISSPDDIAIRLECDEQIDQGDHRCLRERITCCDIDFLYFCGNAMDDGLQQILIA